MVSRDCQPTVQGRGQVPVKERDVGGDLVGEQFVDDAAVVVQALGVGLAGSLGKTRDQEMDMR